MAVSWTDDVKSAVDRQLTAQEVEVQHAEAVERIKSVDGYAYLEEVEYNYKEMPMTREQLNAEEQREKDRKANVITYAIVASTQNRHMNDDEREAIEEVMRQTALELNVKLMLVLQKRYKLTFELTATNTGKRSLPLLVEDEPVSTGDEELAMTANVAPADPLSTAGRMEWQPPHR